MRETLRVEAARVAGALIPGKAFERPKRAVLVSCMAAIFKQDFSSNSIETIAIYMNRLD